MEYEINRSLTKIGELLNMALKCKYESLTYDEYIKFAELCLMELPDIEKTLIECRSQI